MQAVDKKLSWDEAAWEWLKRTFVHIRRTLVCVLCAAMALGVVAFMYAQGMLERLIAQSLLNLVSQSVLPLVPLALAVFAVIHIWKDVPRLLLLFAGSSAFLSIMLLASGWVPALLMLAAGLLLFALEAHRQSGLLKDVPHTKVKGVLLLIAGALALVWAAYQIYYMIEYAKSMSGYSSGITYTFFTSLANFVGGVCIAVACVTKNRPASVYYRMFFTGATAIFVFQSVLSCVTLLQYTDSVVPAMTYIHYIGNAVLVTAVTALIVIHAIITLPKKAAAAEPAVEPAEQTPEDTPEETSEDTPESDTE